jgi:hypothetical protein
MKTLKHLMLAVIVITVVSACKKGTDDQTTPTADPLIGLWSHEQVARYFPDFGYRDTSEIKNNFLMYVIYFKDANKMVTYNPVYSYPGTYELSNDTVIITYDSTGIRDTLLFENNQLKRRYKELVQGQHTEEYIYHHTVAGTLSDGNEFADNWRVTKSIYYSGTGYYDTVVYAANEFTFSFGRNNTLIINIEGDIRTGYFLNNANIILLGNYYYPPYPPVIARNEYTFVDPNHITLLRKYTETGQEYGAFEKLELERY